MRDKEKSERGTRWREEDREEGGRGDKGKERKEGEDERRCQSTGERKGERRSTCIIMKYIMLHANAYEERREQENSRIEG